VPAGRGNGPAGCERRPGYGYLAVRQQCGQAVGVREVKCMIRDRGSNFTAAFDAVLADAGIRIVLCNVQTPRMNATIER
jgi:hypothetical protein